MKIKSFHEKDREALAAEQMFITTQFVGTIWGAALTLTFLFQDLRVPQILSALFLATMILSLFIRSWTNKTRAAVQVQSFAFYFYLVGLMI